MAEEEEELLEGWEGWPLSVEVVRETFQQSEVAHESGSSPRIAPNGEPDSKMYKIPKQFR